MKKFSGWLNKNIVSLSLASLFSDLGYETTTVLLAPLMSSLGGSARNIGYIEGIAEASISILKVITGKQSDLLQKRHFFIWTGYLVTAFGVGSCAFVNNWEQLFFARLITLLGKGIREPARDALFTSSLPSHHLYGRAFGFHRTLDTIGAIIAPIYASLLIFYLSYSTIFLIAFVPCFIAFLIALIIVKEKNTTKKRVQNNLQKNSPNSFKATPEFIRYATILAVFNMSNCALSLLILRTSDLLTTQFTYQVTQSLSIGSYLIFSISCALTAYPLGYAGDLVGKEKMLSGGYLLMAFVYAIFSLHSHSLWSLIMIFICAGVARAIIQSMERAVAAELLEPSSLGQGFGVIALLQGTGSLIGNFTIGTIWSSFSGSHALLYASLVAAIGGILLLLKAVIKKKYVQK